MGPPIVKDMQRDSAGLRKPLVLAGHQGLQRWQVPPGLALYTVFTGRKALVGLAITRHRGVLIVPLSLP